MRLVRRLSTGVWLARGSLGLLRNYPRLVAFRLLGGLATLAFGTLLYLTVFVTDLVDGWLTVVALFSLVPWVGTTTVILGVSGLSVGVSLVGRTVTGIVKTALYVYATEGAILPAFAGFGFEALEGRIEVSTGTVKPIPRLSKSGLLPLGVRLGDDAGLVAGDDDDLIGDVLHRVSEFVQHDGELPV